MTHETLARGRYIVPKALLAQLDRVAGRKHLPTKDMMTAALYAYLEKAEKGMPAAKPPPPPPPPPKPKEWELSNSSFETYGRYESMPLEQVRFVWKDFISRVRPVLGGKQLNDLDWSYHINQCYARYRDEGVLSRLNEEKNEVEYFKDPDWEPSEYVPYTGSKDEREWMVEWNAWLASDKKGPIRPRPTPCPRTYTGVLNRKA